MAPRYRVTLTKQEHQHLTALTRNGKTGAKTFKQRFVEEGLEAALHRKTKVKPPRDIVFDGAFNRGPPGGRRQKIFSISTAPAWPATSTPFLRYPCSASTSTAKPFGKR